MTTRVNFRTADDADLPALAALYDQAARWMRSRGIEQWQPGGKDEEHFRLRTQEGEVWLAEAGGVAGVVLGAYELWWDDEPAWGVRPPEAGYVHRLMTDRTAAPAGLGRTLLAHAERRIAEAGRELVRLDCLTSNPRLRTYYEAAGYEVVGAERVKAGAVGEAPYGVTLLQRRTPLGRPAGPGPRSSNTGGAEMCASGTSSPSGD
ncbi:GNAT family N-acetyltransferase [Streptomyces hypolithicus]